MRITQNLNLRSPLKIACHCSPPGSSRSPSRRLLRALQWQRGSGSFTIAFGRYRATPAPTESATGVRRDNGAKALRLHLAHLRGIYRCRTALVNARGLGRGDAFELSLALQVRFELGEDAKHIKEALAGGGAGIDRLLSRPDPRHRAPLCRRRGC